MYVLYVVVVVQLLKNSVFCFCCCMKFIYKYHLLSCACSVYMVSGARHQVQAISMPLVLAGRPVTEISACTPLSLLY